MRTAVVSSQDLDMNDWRAEHYVAPTPEEIIEAKLAGFTSGASGRPLDPRNQYLRHGRGEIRGAFKEGHMVGSKSRAAFAERIEHQ